MTPQAVLSELLNRLEARQGADVYVGNGELREWPPEAVAALQSARLLVKARPVSSLVCPGCERQCVKSVEVYSAEGARPARAYIQCDEPEDMGRIEVEPTGLEQWRITGAILASAVSRLLGIAKPPSADGNAQRWVLGLLPRAENKGALALSIENGATLTLAGQRIPLAHVVTFSGNGLSAEKDTLLRAVEGDTQEPVSTWLKKKARAAAQARHSKPGGSRDMQERMRAIWASGKYTTRDRCAEEECGALGISFSTARKALRNTPQPKRT
jgi:hypothetical protein